MKHLKHFNESNSGNIKFKNDVIDITLTLVEEYDFILNMSEDKIICKNRAGEPVTLTQSLITEIKRCIRKAGNNMDFYIAIETTGANLGFDINNYNNIDDYIDREIYIKLIFYYVIN